MSEKLEALAEIAEIARVHHLNIEEIAAALKPTPEQKRRDRSGMLTNIFGYFGGLLIVGGLIVLIHMRWAALDSTGHILITAIPALLALILGVVCTFDPRFTKAATPLLLLAASLEPTALIITFREAHVFDRPVSIAIWTALIMTLQQGVLLVKCRRTELALTTLAFGFAMLASCLDMEVVKPRYVGMTLGAMALFFGYALSQSRYRTIAPPIYFIGAAFFLSGFSACVLNTIFEPLFLGICCLLIYISIVVRSSVLLSVSAFGMLSFIVYYSLKHFANTLGWPITLMIAGVLMIGLGIVAMRVNQRYIKPGSS